MLTDILAKVFSNFEVQLNTTIIAVLLYLVNVNIIKTRSMKRFKMRELLFFCLPYLNLAFLGLQVVVFYVGFPYFYALVSTPIKKFFKLVKRSFPSAKRR